MAVFPDMSAVNSHKKLRRRRYLLLALLLCGIIWLILNGLLFEPNDVDVVFHRLETSKLRQGIRVVHLTDLHLDEDTGRDSVPDTVNSLGPDIIVITGDFVNEGPDFTEMLSRVNSYVGRLKASHGIYATFGNWDGGLEDKLFKGSAVRALRDETTGLQMGEDVLTITGMDFSWDHDYNVGRSKPLLEALDKKKFNIFLYHSPDLVEDVSPFEKVDLYLTGHTHGGQVRVPFLGAIRHGFKGRDFPYAGALITFSRFGTKYESGRFDVGNTVLYVSRGIGMEGGAPMIRLFCRPEIDVFDIIPVTSGMQSMSE